MKTMAGGAVAGIDVSKASLDVSVSAGPARRFANTPEGIADLPQWLETQGIAPVVCEPTGGYERRLVSGLRAVGLAVSDTRHASTGPAGPVSWELGGGDQWLTATIEIKRPPGQ